MSIEFTQVIEMGKIVVVLKKFEKTRKISPRGAYFSVFFMLLCLRQKFLIL